MVKSGRLELGEDIYGQYKVYIQLLPSIWQQRNRNLRKKRKIKVVTPGCRVD